MRSVRRRFSLSMLSVLMVLASTSILNSQTLNPTGSFVTGRAGHTETLLQNGKVLVAGGGPIHVAGSDYRLFTTELYDPATGSYSNSGNLQHDRSCHTATLLPNGMVLLAGGTNYDGNQINSAELYNPVTGQFVLTGSLKNARACHTATLLKNGLVLIAGGETITYVNNGGLYINTAIVGTAELYNPTTGQFTLTAPLRHHRLRNTATLLQNGMVLLAGGVNDDDQTLNLAELYDPVTGTFSYTGNLNHDRQGNTATLLNNGKVLITGGTNADFESINSAELYDPVTGHFSYTGNMQYPRAFAAATLLTGSKDASSGKVLLIGGATKDVVFLPQDLLSLPELYDPSTGTFSSTAPLYKTGTVNPITTEMYNVRTVALATPTGQVLITFGPPTCCQTLGQIYTPLQFSGIRPPPPSPPGPPTPPS